MKRTLALLGLFAAVLAALPTPAAAANHVRVVLDLSTSMATNDPGRLAVLSTLLLHDLAQPNPTLGDSFEVLPFDADWQWPDPDAPPPVSRRPRIRAQVNGRADFVRALQALRYEAKATYFYPGVLAALEDLEQARGGAYDVRAIVLVTDGVPLKKTRERELQKLRDELAPRLEKSGIRLYILAFGGEADRNRDFFREMLRTPGGATLGENLVDPQGTELLTYMLRIFSSGFGFSPDASRPLPGTTTLDLEGGTTPERVAVAVFSGRPQPPPRLRLTPPPGGSVNSPEGVQSAGETGGSYSLLWVLSPNPGDYGVDSDAIPGSVAVLRPTRLALEVLPAPPHTQTERTLAGTPFPLRILVRSPTGALGDPGPVDLSFRPLGRRSPNSEHVWQGRRGAPPPGQGTATPRGRIYDIVTEFQEDPETPGETYAGYLEVEARRGGAVVGALAGQRAHRVEVHPLLAIVPFPSSDYAATSALGRRQQGCTRFELRLDAGILPHPDRPQYPLRAVVAPADPAVIDRELHEASLTLDGLPLEFAGRPGAQTGAWNKGRPLAADELLGPHEICIRMGRPKAGDPAQPLDLPLALTLVEVPYDDFEVIQPFVLKVRVAPPGFLERWRAPFLGALMLLAVLALLWYLRDRPAFPADLRYAIGREDGGRPPEPRPLPERSLAARLLGGIAESAVVAPGEERVLGRVRPVDAELYKLRPARGVRVEAVGREEAVPMHRGLATLAVHRTYRLRTDRGSYLFRLEYR